MQVGRPQNTHLGSQRRRRRCAYSALAIVICLSTSVAWLPAVFAQPAPEQVVWEEPVLLHQTTGDILQPSTIVADPWGTVHILWSEKPTVAPGEQAPYSLWYMRRQDGEWSQPHDVLVSPDNMDALRASAGVDSKEQLHVVWNSLRQPYSYSMAPIAGATQAHEWLTPESVAGTGVVDAALAVDSADRLHVVYASWGQGVYYQAQDIGTGIWSDPVLVAEPVSDNQSPESARVVVGENGTIHIFWTEAAYPESYPPVAAYHARSTDGGATWLTPQEIAGPGYRAESAVTYGNNVHVLLLGTASENQRLHKRSTNGGRSWSGARIIVPKTIGSGLSGGSLAVDSAGTLHAVTGIRIDKAVGYASGDGNTWSPPVDIPGIQGTSLEDISMALGSGNKLHVMFVDSHKRLWYVEGQTTSPAVEPRPRAERPPDNTPSPTISASPTLQPSPQLTPTVGVPQFTPTASNSTTGSTTSPLTVLLLAIGPVIVLILVVLAWKLNWFNRIK